ncbi:MAG: TIGR01777 family oxidoreductase [Pseudohongiellaceae bacterium]
MAQDRCRNILITGASGMIGSALSAHLSSRGFTVYPLRRDSTTAPFFYQEAEGRVHLDPKLPLYGVINLAGPGIADKRWSASRKRVIRRSRQQLTQALAAALAASESKPQILVSASAIGYYGLTGDNCVDEDDPAANDFLAGVAKDWESATLPAVEAGINTVHLRFGIVLSPDGGVLGKLLLPFKLGLGGPIGRGDQLMSWISMPDVLQIIHKLLNDKPHCGPLNLVADHPITNADFSADLAQALRRPHFLPLPEFMVKLLFGEMGEALLLGSVGVCSKKLAPLGIELQYPTLSSALEILLKPDK